MTFRVCEAKSHGEVWARTGGFTSETDNAWSLWVARVTPSPHLRRHRVPLTPKPSERDGDRSSMMSRDEMILSNRTGPRGRVQESAVADRDHLRTWW